MGFLYHITFFSACLSFLFSFTQIIHPQRNKKRSVTALTFLFTGLILIYYPYINSLFFEKFPYLFLLHLPILFFVGPTLAKLLFLFLEERVPAWLDNPLNFLPGLLSILFYMPFYMMTAKKKIMIARQMLEDGVVYSTIHYSRTLSILHILIYLGLSIHLLFRHFTFRRLYEIQSFRFVVILTSISLISASGGLLISVGYRNLGFFLGYFFLSLLIPEIFIIQVRFPKLFEEARIAIAEEKKYRISQLNNLDLDKIRGDINRLFNENKIYLESDVSLASVAKEIGISSHRLSEYLNTVENKTFKTFINTFRLSHAVTLFHEKRDWTILKIAFEAGFQSKTAFNVAFHKEYGVSPSVYRKKTGSGL